MQWLPKLRPKKAIQKWLDWNALSSKRIIEKILCFHVGDHSCLRHYPTVWRNFILQYKTINLGTGGDWIENVLWCINDTVLPKSIRSVIIHWGTNNIDTGSSDEISVSMVTIARSISHGYPNTKLRTFIGLCRE